MYAMGIDFSSVSTIFLLDFGIVHTVWYIFCLHFISFQATSMINILVLTDIFLLKTFITSINIRINEENDELPTLPR